MRKKSPARLALLAFVAVLLVCALAGAAVFGYYYHKYGVIVDQRLQKPLFVNTARVYAAPRQVRVGQRLTAAIVAQQLRAAGYSENGSAPMGTFAANEDSITVRPGPQSYHAPEDATITFGKGKVQQISTGNGQQLASYALEPLLITGLSDANRAKRQLVTYNELPPYLISAVTSIEDRRFFSHGGVDYIRLLGAARADVLHHGYHGSTEGGSTLTMQLARGFFLTPEKRLKRKALEIMITWHLESHFTKQQIFQMYANQIPLGQAGSFAINGFGEAAEVYFGKDVSKLDLPECALLAGMIQSPSRLNPLRHAARAVERRNIVLNAMAETGAINKAQAEEAKAAPLKLAPLSVQQDRAPYFIDLVRDQITAKLGDTNWNQEGLRVYTSLDPQLQAIAGAAVDEGMQKVDAMVEHKHARLKLPGSVVYPQVALVALDPHTGQILALVGGRNYGLSQLNHAVAHRPTGSTFKPFVYAAAFNSSLAGTQLAAPDGTTGIFTPVTMLPDNEDQVFQLADGTVYTPHNMGHEQQDTMTALNALKLSQNIATITLAQMVGFGNVAALARDAGIASARATPSVAIGAYASTPIELAGSYTAFANGGTVIKPWMLASLRSANGDPLQDYTPASHPVLDPRVAYLTTSMMEAVVNSGTGASIRAQGFAAPAAGKTGTEHDAWFAGYTSNLLCVVWVGNDDYSDLHLEGNQAAIPIWTAFMKGAVKLAQYSDTKPFDPPQGVSMVTLDKSTNLLADASCPTDYTAAFLDGTAPVSTCDQPVNDQRNVFQKIFGIGQKPAVGQQQASPAVQQQQPLLPTQRGVPSPVAPPANTSEQQEQPQKPKPEEKKPGFFGRLFGHKPKQESAPQP